MSLTKMPDNELARKKGWERLTAENGLFVYLQQCVQQQASETVFQEMLTHLESWDAWQRVVEIPKYIIPSFQHQSQAARALIQLAKLAVRQPTLSKAQMFEQIDCGFDKAWRWDAFCALSDNLRRPLPGTEQSISVLLEQDEFGCLTRLETELIADGTGQLYADPTVNAFLEFDAETFLAGAREVWDLVKLQFAEEADQQRLAAVDVRFRLKRLHVPGNYRNPQLHYIEGKSAQAAFFLSLFQTAGAYLGKSEALLLGDTIAASATIVPDNLFGVALGSVTALESKLKVAYLSGLAVVVVSKADETAAQKALRDSCAHDKDDEVRPLKTEVVGLGTIAELLGFLRDRAKEREAVRRYEQEHCAKLKVVGRDDVDLATHYQELPLLRQVKRDRLLRDDRERDESGRQPGADKDDRFASLRGIELHRWEESLQQELFADKQFSLDEVLTNFRKVIEAARSDVPRFFVLGPPGSGKTTLVQYLAWRAANHDLKLRGKHLLPARVSLRLWERSNAEAKCDLPEYLAERYRSEKIPHPPTADHWRDWLRRGEVLLLLDGQDEINGDAPFLEALTEALANYSECPMIITCRTVSFEQHRALTPDFPVFVLGAMNTEQRDRSIRAYAAGRSFDADALIAQLNHAPQMNALTANPLLLSLLCYAVDDTRGVKLPVRRSELYDKTIEKLLTRPKRVPVTYPNRQSDMPLVRKRRILEQAALTLFTNQDQQRQLTFDEADLLDAITVAAKQQGYGDAPAPYADALLDDLLNNSGLLRGTREQGYFFLHLTVQESLASGAIAKQINQQGWDEPFSLHSINITPRNFVDCVAWDPRYQEVIILLAGKLIEPGPMLELLADESNDDFSHHRLAVAAQCLSEVKRTASQLSPSPIDWINQVTSHALGVWWKHAIKGPLWAVPHLTLALPALWQVNGQVNQEVIIDRSGNRICPNIPTIAQQQLPLRNLLLALLREEDTSVRSAAVLVIKVVGKEAVESEVSVALATRLHDADKNVRVVAAENVSKIGVIAGTSEILAALTSLLDDPDENVRSMAATAVGEIGAPAGTPEILFSLAKLFRTQGGTWGYHADKALEKIGAVIATPEIISVLISLLHDENSWVRNRAARVVANAEATRTMPEIIAALPALLSDKDSGVRSRAGWTVSCIGEAAGTPEILSALAALLSDAERTVLMAVASAIRNVGEAATSREFLNALASNLSDPGDEARLAILEQCGTINVSDAPMVVTFLAPLLNNVNESVRLATAGVYFGIEAAASPDLLTALIPMLHDPDLRVRLAAIGTVAQIGSKSGSPEILSALASSLRHESEWVRYVAAIASGAVGVAAATPEILDGLCLLLRDENKDVRSAATEAVVKIGISAATPEILDLLPSRLREAEVGVRQQAAKGLGDVAATPEILATLSELLRDENKQVRYAAAEAVKEIGSAAGTPEILDALAALLCDKASWENSVVGEAVVAVGEAAATPEILSRFITHNYTSLLVLMANGLRIFELSKGEFIGRDVMELSDWSRK